MSVVLSSRHCCAALIGPYFVDWTSYRSDFEREASAILGRKVEVKGEAEARILPFPSLSFTDIVVGGDEEPALTAESFSMDAELAPFLSGEVLIFDMRIVKPSARVIIGEDGVIDWTVRPSTPFDPSRIALEKLTIVDGKAAHFRSRRRPRASAVGGELDRFRPLAAWPMAC